MAMDKEWPDAHQKNPNQSSFQVCTSHWPVGPIFVVANCLLLIVGEETG